MPTTIHLPESVLKRVDSRAKRLGVTRSRYICETLENDLQKDDAWPEDFIAALRDVQQGDKKAVDAMLKNILKRRTRSLAPKL